MTFEQFYHAVTGHVPFDWQSRLARECLESDPARIAMPDVCKLPTASGKTAVILIGLYAMAMRPEAQRRIAYVVDRRIVADAGYDMVWKLKERLDANDEVLAPWAELLRKTCGLGPEDSLLDVHLLRGGLGEPLAKLKSPLTPTVMISTVDQLGSRLLFRGYGASARSWPIAAGLLAYDTLWILDEAHISTAFSQTLASVRAIVSAGPIARPMAVVELTATPRDSAGVVFSLGVPDARIAPRLQTSKVTTIETVGDEKIVPNAVLGALDREYQSGCKRIGIIVNRVRLARDIFEQAKKKYRRAHVVLLIGSIRQYDRERLYDSAPVTSLFANVPLPKLPTIAICTQTIEVGADFDFDSLITQSAPIDVLKQRFGRLDRIGKFGNTRGTIVHVISGGIPDPIYGRAIDETVTVLEPYANAGLLDFGVSNFDALRIAETAAMRAAVKEAEPLVAPHIERLSQTWTVPYDSPDISAFLHGEPTGGDVTICWRRHLEADDDTSWGAQVRAAYPTSGEVLSVPLYAARAWLRRKRADEADVPIVIEIDGDDVTSEGKDRPAYRISADATRDKLNAKSEIGEVVRRAYALRAGDTLVVPASYGGCDEFGWNPSAKEPVSDLCELAYLNKHRTRARLALNLPQEDEEDDRDDVVRAALDDVAVGPSGELAAIAMVLQGHFGNVSVDGVHGITWLTWRGKFSDDEETDSTSLLDRCDVTLEDHSAHVRDRARLFALACQLPQWLVEIIAGAGWRHDLGKADVPFQMMLGNGKLSDKLLAKGRRGRTAPEKRLSYVAWHFRHELVSVSMLGDLAVFVDPALLRHLVGSSHGYGRPWFPITYEREDRVVKAQLNQTMFTGSSAAGLGRLDSGWVEQFVDLSQRYTAWGLAYLEAILRLADHRCSEDEEQGRL